MLSVVPKREIVSVGAPRQSTRSLQGTTSKLFGTADQASSTCRIDSGLRSIPHQYFRNIWPQSVRKAFLTLPRPTTLYQ
jgi:hypothetical protein